MPVLFVIGGVPIYSHGFFLTLGVLACVAFFAYDARRRHLPATETVPIALGAFVGAVLGARIAMLFFTGFDAAGFVIDYLSYFDPAVGPGSILGAVVGAYGGGYILSRSVGHAACTCDSFAPAMALGMTVGRIGDFLAGEDGLGKASDLPWAVHVPGVDYLVHPTPLYDAAFNFVWFAVLVALRAHPRLQDGNLLKLGIAGYAVFRFCVEFVRSNPVVAFGLTAQQYACVLILVTLSLYYLRPRGRTWAT